MNVDPAPEVPAVVPGRVAPDVPVAPTPVLVDIRALVSM
jgi:hypothetical protein